MATNFAPLSSPPEGVPDTDEDIWFGVILYFLVSCWIIYAIHIFWR
jgi:hypothetical protein